MRRITRHAVSRPAVSVILPTYNEREGIAGLVPRFSRSRRAGSDLEVLVVDDASPDGTAAQVEATFQTDPAVRVRVRRDERGLASAIYHVVRRGGRVLEIPTVYRFRKGGESKARFFAYFWTYLASVFRLRLTRR